MINTPYVTKANSKSRALECGFVLRYGPDREWRRRERISGWLCQTSWFSRPRVEIHTGTVKAVWQGRGLFLHSRMIIQTLDFSKEMPCLRDCIRNFHSPEEWEVRRTRLTVLQSMGGTETVQIEQFLKMGPRFKFCRPHVVVRSRGWLSYGFWIYHRQDMLPSPQEDAHGQKSTRPVFIFYHLFTYFWLCYGFLEWWLLLLLSMSSSSFGTWAQELLFPRSRAQLPQLWHLAFVVPRVWDLLRPGIESVSPTLASRFFYHWAPREAPRPILMRFFSEIWRHQKGLPAEERFWPSSLHWPRIIKSVFGALWGDEHLSHSGFGISVSICLLLCCIQSDCPVDIKPLKGSLT